MSASQDCSIRGGGGRSWAWLDHLDPARGESRGGKKYLKQLRKEQNTKTKNQTKQKTKQEKKRKVVNTRRTKGEKRHAGKKKGFSISMPKPIEHNSRNQGL